MTHLDWTRFRTVPFQLKCIYGRIVVTAEHEYLRKNGFGRSHAWLIATDQEEKDIDDMYYID